MANDHITQRDCAENGSEVAQCQGIHCHHHRVQIEENIPSNGISEMKQGMLRLCSVRSLWTGISPSHLPKPLAVVSLGGNALLQRQQSPSIDNQAENIRTATSQIRSLLPHYTLCLSHGNGPQCGLLAEQALHSNVPSPPLCVLTAETEGQIGWMLEVELRNQIASEAPSLANGIDPSHVVSLLTQVEVLSDDPAMEDPTKFIGPVYKTEHEALAAGKGAPKWQVKRDGDHGWRRVVASPTPHNIVEIAAIQTLLENQFLVICGGGGGIPVVYESAEGSQEGGGKWLGADAVVDKDETSALLAHQLDAQVLILLTDVDAVYRSFGKPDAERLSDLTPDEADEIIPSLAAGSMQPKLRAAAKFVRGGQGRRAVIGSLHSDPLSLIQGVVGTAVADRV